jgi:trehalose 6-phosphate phosphatase
LSEKIKSQFEPFLNRVAHSPDAVLLLDYDGTLAPFRTRRDQAYPYPGVEFLLQEIVRSCRTRVVVISGRDATEVFALLNLRPRPEVWGSHGMQRLKADGSACMQRLDARTLDGLSDADRWLGQQQLRHVAEFKAGGVAIHWRGFTENAARDLRTRILQGWGPIADRSGLELLEFDGGIEIRARHANKGDAVRTLIDEIGPVTPIAYLGDDSTDESAFEALEGRGLTVLVRPIKRKTAAQYWLKPPEELLNFLDLWLKTCLEQYSRDAKAAAATNR